MSDAAGSPESGASDRSDTASLARRLLLIPIVVCVAQAVVLLVIAGTAVADPGRGWASVIVEVIVLVLLAAGLIVIAVGLAKVRGWARGPLIALEIIALLTGLAIGLDTWQGPVLAVAAAASVLTALSRPVADLLEGGPTPESS